MFWIYNRNMIIQELVNLKRRNEFWVFLVHYTYVRVGSQWSRDSKSNETAKVWQALPEVMHVIYQYRYSLV